MVNRPWYWPKEGQPHRTEPFTWIERGKIAASWWPDPYVFDIYKTQGIKAVINCSEFDNERDVPDEFNYYFIHIPDYGIASDEQIERFLKIAEEYNRKDQPVVVHCVAGCGRTGQLIVAWGAHFGIIPEDKDPVKWIREHRECSLESQEQMEAARKIAKKFRG